MKKIFTASVLLLVACSVLMGDQKVDQRDIKKRNVENPQRKKVIEYRALVYIDEPSLARYGGKAKFSKNLEKMFLQTTLFFNNSKNKFENHIKFVPKGLKVYPYVEGEKYEEAANEAKADLDPEKYDYVLFLCLAAPNNTMACGGTSDGHAVMWCTKTLETQKKDGNIFEDGDFPNKLGTYSNLGHEAGHVLGTTDLYQFPIKPQNNPINGQEFKPDACNMGTGTWVWSDYASAMVNHTSKLKRLKGDWAKETYPQSVEIAVMRKGQPVKNAQVRLYGCRAFGKDKGLPSNDNGPDVYSKPFRVAETNDTGKVAFDNAYRLFQVDWNAEKDLPKELPWGYWFNFLVEAEDDQGKKAYTWMPSYEVIRQRLDEKTDVYRTQIIFE